MGLGERTDAVSVIIPVFNTQKYISDCVMSALSQSITPIEIILVDDGSTDGSALLCDRLSESADSVIAVHRPNGGLSAARNIGIGLAGGKYLLFLDSDDELTPDALKALTEIAVSEDADIVMPDRYIKTFEESDNKKLIYHFGKRDHISDPVGFALRVMMENGRAWRATALLYRRSCICENAVWFPDGRIAEDIVFNLRLLPHVRKITFCDRPTMYNLVRTGSISHTYHPKYLDTILFIDHEASKFLDTACVKEKVKKHALHSLLMGSTAVYLTAVMDPSVEGFCYPSQKKRFLDILTSPRVNEARKQRGLTFPCFDSRLAYWYIRVFYLLIRLGFCSIAARVAYLSNKLRNRI